MPRCLVALLLFIGIAYAPRVLGANYHFTYSARCQQAYAAYGALRPAAGDALIRQEFLADPYNLCATYIADYGDFLTLLFNGDPKELSQRESHKDERLDLISEAPDSDPWKRLARGGIYLHWALINARFGNQFHAALDFRKSFMLIKENAQKFPQFAPNAVFLGLQEAVAGTIPEDYKWMASLFGMNGNVRNGERRLAAYVSKHTAGDPFQEEAIIYLQYLRFYLVSHQAEVWNFVSNESLFPAKGNLMRLFVRANIALNYRKADVALTTLRAAQALPGSGNYPVFDYEVGNALFFKLDAGCVAYFERFVSHNTGRLYTKDALQKAAFAWYLQGKMSSATPVLNRIMASGSLLTDADKGAQRFAKDPQWPNATLLQARLLLDGGFASQALAKLRSIDQRVLSNPSVLIEYYFRLGRAQDETGDAPSAVQTYQKALNAGRNRPEQYAARAALQMALIYERGNQKKEAIQYFNICLSLRHHDFQSSIDQQAKAGINRLSN